MSEIELFGIKISYPKFDFVIEALNKQHLFPHKYMKYFIILCIFLGLRSLLKRMKNIILAIMYNIRLKFSYNSPIKANNRWIVILGFGDNINSVPIAKHFAKRGYNLLLLVDENVSKVRKQYNLNEIQEINKLTHVNIIEYDYDNFISAKDFDLENGLIEYVIDTSVLRLYNDDLSQSDKENHLDSVFYNDAISHWTNKYSKMLDRLRLYFNIRDSRAPLRIFLFNYPDKAEEVNHKIFYDIRKALYLNYQEVYKGAILFATIKFHNEFKGYYFSEKQLKCLEMLKISNKENSLFIDTNTSTEEITELNFI